MSKSVWGPATWSLLHCLVLKISDDIPKSTLDELKTVISSIFSNLPCPICSNHAVSLMNSSGFKQINTIAALRVYMFHFHNKVNETLKKPQMKYEDHLILYNQMNFELVVKNVFNIYNNLNTGVTMMLYSFHRTNLLRDIDAFLKKNQGLYRLH
jgi:hypothetical protein